MPSIGGAPASSNALPVARARAAETVTAHVTTDPDVSGAGDGLTRGDGYERGGVARPVRGRVAGGLGVVGVRSLPAYSLPDHVELGVNTIHRYTDNRVSPPVIAVTVFAPMPTAEFPGTVLDLNAKTHAERLPDRCIIGDAGFTRAFIGIDQRPGTPLDLALEKILQRVDRHDPEKVIEFVRTQTNSIIAWAPGSSRNDGAAHFDWDKAIGVPDAAWDAFRSVAYQDVGDAPVATGASFPVVPFERWLAEGQGYCIQKAVLGALLLEKAGIPCRLAQGAVALGPGKTCGHSWIELADGRVLDPAWSRLEKPTQRDPDFPERFFFGGSYRFENQRFPYLRD